MKASPDKGFGVFASQTIAAGEVVCEYVGDLLDPHQAVEREREYDEQAERDVSVATVMSYQLFFPWRGATWW